MCVFGLPRRPDGARALPELLTDCCAMMAWHGAEAGMRGYLRDEAGAERARQKLGAIVSVLVEVRRIQSTHQGCDCETRLCTVLTLALALRPARRLTRWRLLCAAPWSRLHCVPARARERPVTCGPPRGQAGPSLGRSSTTQTISRRLFFPQCLARSAFMLPVEMSGDFVLGSRVTQDHFGLKNFMFAHLLHSSCARRLEGPHFC